MVSLKFMVIPNNLTDTADFSFAAWIQWDGGDAWQRILDVGAGTDKYMFLNPPSPEVIPYGLP